MVQQRCQSRTLMSAKATDTLRTEQGITHGILGTIGSRAEKVVQCTFRIKTPSAAVGTTCKNNIARTMPPMTAHAP